MCCDVLRCVCVLQCSTTSVRGVAVCCGVLQCAAVCEMQCMLQCPTTSIRDVWNILIFFIFVPRLIHTRDMPYLCVSHSPLYVWHVVSIGVTGLISMRATPHSHARHAWCMCPTLSFACLTRRIHRCDRTHLYVWHDVFIYVTRLLHTRDFASFMCLALLIFTCEISHPYVCHDSSICMTWRIHICDKPYSYARLSYLYESGSLCLIWMSHVSYV